jgi:hypothetical protein
MRERILTFIAQLEISPPEMRVRSYYTTRLNFERINPRVTFKGDFSKFEDRLFMNSVSTTLDSDTLTNEVNIDDTVRTANDYLASYAVDHSTQADKKLYPTLAIWMKRYVNCYRLRTSPDMARALLGIYQFCSYTPSKDYHVSAGNMGRAWFSIDPTKQLQFFFLLNRFKEKYKIELQLLDENPEPKSTWGRRRRRRR